MTYCKSFKVTKKDGGVDCNYLFRDYLFIPNDIKKEIFGVDIPFVLLADPAYLFLPWMVNGYPRNEASRYQQVFNYHISRARMTVKNTFGRWKGRFTRFSKRVDMEVPSLVDVVLASCVVHNIREVQNKDASK